MLLKKMVIIMKRILFKIYVLSAVVLCATFSQPVMGMQNELLPCSKKLELDFAKSLGDKPKNENTLLLDKFFSNWDTNDVKDNGKTFTSFFTKQDKKDSLLISWFVTSLKDKENKNINLDFSDDQDDTCLNYRLLGDFTGIFDNRFMYYDEKGKKNPAQEITPWVINALEIKDCTIGLDKNDKLSQFFKDLCATRSIEKELYEKSKNQKNNLSTDTPQSFLVCKGYVNGTIEEINNVLQKYKNSKKITPKKTILTDKKIVPVTVKASITKKDSNLHAIVTVVVYVGAVALVTYFFYKMSPANKEAMKEYNSYLQENVNYHKTRKTSPSFLPVAAGRLLREDITAFATLVCAELVLFIISKTV
jgi:uncharacterized protein YxeA